MAAGQYSVTIQSNNMLYLDNMEVRNIVNTLIITSDHFSVYSDSTSFGRFCCDLLQLQLIILLTPWLREAVWGPGLPVTAGVYLFVHPARSRYVIRDHQALDIHIRRAWSGTTTLGTASDPGCRSGPHGPLRIIDRLRSHKCLVLMCDVKQIKVHFG